MAKPVSRRGFCMAAFTLDYTHGNTAFIRNRSSSSAKGRWLMFTRATAFRWSPRKRLAVMSTAIIFRTRSNFWNRAGNAGRQRGILREGVYAINLALFVVISDERVFSGPVRESSDRYESWKAQLASIRAYDPVVIGSAAGLPLSLVLHIDYQKAPSVVQRFRRCEAVNYSNT